MSIKSKPMSGPYYREGAVSAWLIPLAQDIERSVPVQGDIELSYDPDEDFFHCKFQAHGRSFDIKYYKVFSLYVDGKSTWDCVKYEASTLVQVLADEKHWLKS